MKRREEKKATLSIWILGFVFCLAQSDKVPTIIISNIGGESLGSRNFVHLHYFPTVL